MKKNALPNYDSGDNPTNCCPRFNPEGWDEQNLYFRDKLFAKVCTRHFWYVPLNMGQVFSRAFDAIHKAGAYDPEDFIVLSRTVSPWKSEHYFAISKDVPGLEKARLNGDYLTKVYEGPYRDAGNWHKGLIKTAGAKQPANTFFFYTTCPECAKFYGKNYVVGFVEMAA